MKRILKTRLETGKQAQEIAPVEELLKKTNLTDTEIGVLIDYAGNLDTEQKAVKKKFDAAKTVLVQSAKERDWVAKSGEAYDMVITAKDTAEVTLTPTKMVAFLKSIDKLDLVDMVLSIPITALKKYVDIHTLTKNKILKTTTEKFGAVSFKRK